MCMRERGRERECVCKREGGIESVFVYERKRAGEILCVCLHQK